MKISISTSAPTKKRLWQIWLTLAVLGLIFCLSAQSNSAHFTAQFFGSYNHAARKTAHMLEHAALFTALYWTALALRARSSSGSPGISTKLLLCATSLLLTINFAALDEWHQSFVPGRTSCAADVLWDSAGASAACLMQLSFHYLSLRRKQVNSSTTKTQ